MNVPFFAFRDFPPGLQAKVQQALVQAVEEKEYILGSRVQQFEQEFGAYLGCPFVTGTGNGYDALLIGLKALGITAGDEVIVPANSFIATANAVANLGARPVLADPDPSTSNLTAQSAQRHLSPRTKALLPVHLFGQACEMDGLMALAKDQELQLVEDFAQSQGARYKGRMTGTFGQVGATSFYPVKNLGALGDGGALVTQAENLDDFIRKYHNYGQVSKYLVELPGVNSRLDTLQAAVLQEKLASLDLLNQERQRMAGVYHRELAGIGDLGLPVTAPYCEHVYHVYSVSTGQRDALQDYLAVHNILTLVHYPIPIHLQEGYRYLGYQAGDFPVAERLARTSLSLPVFPGLQEDEQAYVVQTIKAFFKRN
jgi:dTDP-4-amino-4,6-dideoxygalactose transaminase